MENKNNSKPKMKAAKKVKEEVEAKVAQAKSDAPKVLLLEEPKSIPVPKLEDEDADGSVTQCQTDSKPPDVPESSSEGDSLMNMSVADVTLHDFSMAIEAAFIATMDQREVNKKKEHAEYVRQQRAKGFEPITYDNALVKGCEYLQTLVQTYNLYSTHNSAIDKQQSESKEIADKNNETSKRLETIIGRIEDVQGVKAPKQPTFPSFACLTYLFWHWPMYAFAYCWLSKYFRRFCFLLAIFLMVLEFCVIVLLAGDNKTMHYAVSKYNTVRNWSLVDDDTSAMNRFNKVDLLFEDPEFNRDEIIELNDTIKSKYERWKERRRKEMERGHRR